MTDNVYEVQSAKPWHKTKLTAEEWFLQNPPHVWRSLDDAVTHYMASGFELVSRSSNMGLEGYAGLEHAALHATSRYTPKRYFLRTVLPWTILTLGVALPVFIWHYIWRTMEEERPYISIVPDPHGSGVFLEERKKGNAVGVGPPMVHPETGQTGWTGVPEGYYQNVIQGWHR